MKTEDRVGHEDCRGRARGSLPTVALTGNPNVGKSSLFNRLTGMKQHTGNWTGKTVSVAEGICRTEMGDMRVIDLPGTYSLSAASVEESLASEYVREGEWDLCVVVCDATAPARGINLLLQILRIARGRVYLCLNLADEATRRGITVDVEGLSRELGVTVRLTSARRRGDVRGLAEELYSISMEEYSRGCSEGGASACDAELHASFADPEGCGSCVDCDGCADCGANCSPLRATEPCESVRRAECITGKYFKGGAARDMNGHLDRLLTGRWLAYPMLFLLLVFILYLTVSLANYPSHLLSLGFSYLGERLASLLAYLGARPMLASFILDGVYGTLADVVSVMLPPMAIFFPLFTLLEDVGVLPRVAYVLDAPLRAVGGCGKQALTMCMGLGCNAAGIVGCRIIDSPRERRLAILTNSLMPCNGRFPTVILLSGLFFSVGGVLSGLTSAVALAIAVTVGIGATLLLTLILSRTVCRGDRSFFVIEIPPPRAPDIGAVLVRSFIDRTLLLLGRAAVVAIPAGALLWCLSTVTVGGVSLLAQIVAVLDPIGRVMGLDGVMLTAFILGTPANEIVLPVALMGYTACGAVPDGVGISEALLAAGWTPLTAISCVVFSLMHWPCATSLITVYRETGSIRDTLLAAIAPTALGFTVCALLSLVGKAFGW